MAHQRLHFMWNDHQLTRRGTSTQKLNLLIDNENTEVWVKRAFCEGVKTMLLWRLPLHCKKPTKTKQITSSSKLIIVQRNWSTCSLLQMTEGDGLVVYLKQTTVMRNRHLSHNPFKMTFTMRWKRIVLLRWNSFRKAANLDFSLQKPPLHLIQNELQKRGCWHWKTGIVPQPGIVPLLLVLQFDEFKKE